MGDRRIGQTLVSPPAKPGAYLTELYAERDSAMLVRGQDTFGNFVHERTRKSDMDPDALAEHPHHGAAPEHSV